MIIKTGIFNEYQNVCFYDGKVIKRLSNLSSRSILLSDDWMDNLPDADRYYIEKVNGVILDNEVTPRRARKMNLDKNDIFSIKENNENTNEKENNLYLPVELIRNMGTVKQMETDTGYWLYNKYLIKWPISVKVGIIHDITKEQADNYWKEWGCGYHGNEKIIKGETKWVHVKETDTVYPEFSSKWVHVKEIDMVYPEFSLLLYSETVRNDFGNKVDRLQEAFKEKANVKLFASEIESLLKVFDITEKKQEA